MCWSWNIFQLTGLGIGVCFFLSVCEGTFPFIKHHHGAVLEVFLQGSGERLKPSSCRVPGKYNCMRGQWNKCQTPGVLGLTHLGATWGWVVPLHQTSQDLGTQMWAGRGGEEMAQPTEPTLTDVRALQIQLPPFLLRKDLPKHKGLLVCGPFVHWDTDDIRCRHFPLWIFLPQFSLFPLLGCSLVWYIRSALGRSCEARGLTATGHRRSWRGAQPGPLEMAAFSVEEHTAT